MKSVLLGGLSFFIVSCSTSTGTEKDNLGYRYTVMCKNEVQDCYSRCTELCPDGYLVINRVRSRRIDESNSEYSVIIRCKQKLVKP